MLQKVTRLDSVPTAEETVLTTEVPTTESRLYTLLRKPVFRGLHPRSLISAFVIRVLESIKCKLASGEISIF